MKKFITGAILAVLLTTAAVAQQGYSSLGAHVSLPIGIQSQKGDYYVPYVGTFDAKILTTNTNFGFGINGMSMFTDVIGLYSSMDFTLLMSQSTKMTIAGSSSGTVKMKRKEMKDAGMDSEWGVDLIIGPAFKLLYTDNIFLYAAPGIHYYMEYMKVGSAASSGGYAGIGASVDMDFTLAEHFALQAGVDMAFDFLAFGDFKVDDVKQFMFGFSPKVGVAYKF